MIRVGFVFTQTDDTWVGGLVYLRNLLRAVAAVPDRQIEPVLIVPPEMPAAKLEGFDGVEVVRTRVLSRGRLARKLRSWSHRAAGRDILMELLLKKTRIDALSHSPRFDISEALPAISWIPDFQHVRLPEFFRPEELKARDQAFRAIANDSATVILSSVDAQNDFVRFAPDAAHKTQVLRFVAGQDRRDDPRGREFLWKTHGIEGPYFYLPNQFWKHKNHCLVIDALGVLAQRGQAPTVVSTGHTDDYRNPGHFEALMAHAREVGAAPFLKVLGLVPYDHLPVLMQHALAVINPSLFEGWSTTVEEAKSLGKAVILSDIPVHREQAPERAIYVGSEDPGGMAEAMITLMHTWSPDEDKARCKRAAAELPGRVAAFGEAYQTIVLGTLSRP